ncbi:hypothetical protein [Rossellomorea marisflavi]|uniref:hypothetical protein n=1 Tax=Rossellomorea marisflavi TaxID=189381 RepID=UPI000AA5975E|nr:hypothetical protein [Rossellomorea marisflavi]MCM2605750.1 hypothetical protein [Rossellomorea marisflavi]
MLWIIIGIAVVFGLGSALINGRRETSSFDVANDQERVLQEEERIKASSWFGGGL